MVNITRAAKERCFLMEMVIKGIKVSCDADIPEEEARAYVDHLEEKLAKEGNALDSLSIHVDGDDVDLSYEYSTAQKFERIRRITGYLVGTLDRFNDAKRAEESDRVKHAVRV